MKKIILIITILVIFVGGFWYVQNESTAKSSMDCGIDIGCFNTNFKSCTPSKLYGGSVEVLSGTRESCNIIFRNEDAANINKGKMLIMECTIKDSHLFKNKGEEFGSPLLSPVFIYNDKNAICRGSFYDFLVDVSKRADEMMAKSQKQ